MDLNSILKKIGSLVTHGCLTLIIGMIGVIVLLWGIGTCMGDEDERDDADSIVVANQTDKETSPFSSFKKENVEYSTLDDASADVSLDESSTVVSSTGAVTQTAKELRDMGEQYWYQEDYTNAYKCFKKASDMGDGLSSKAIGKMYLEGIGKKKDYMLAAIYFQKGIDQGAPGCYACKGYVYYHGGNNLPKDLKTAVEYFQKSADMGEAIGQQWMGFLYQRGEGVPKNTTTAIEWYMKAADQGDEVSIKKLEEMGFAMIDKPKTKQDNTTKPNNTTKQDNTTRPNNTTKPTTTQTKPKATVTWLTTATTTSQRKYHLEAGIKSESKVENVVVKLNGQSDRGIKTVNSDGYDMRVNRDLTLAEGTNTIRIEVTNAGGTTATERKVTYTTATTKTQTNPTTTQKTTNKTDNPVARVNTGQKRVALIVGNSNYTDSNMRLSNPVNDAADLSAKLVQLGFTVVRSLNQTQKGMEDAVQLFGSKAQGADVALFFYAGHGIQYQGENYLVPIDAKLPSEEYVKYNCTNAGLVLDVMENAGAKMKIVILDACRNNPFSRSWYRGKDSMGLGIMSAPKGTFIAFSTSPGEVALDGNGQRNSPYTSALLQTLDKKGLSITDFFQEVLERVVVSTKEKQTPWTSNSFRGKFIFNPE